jgi:HK97 gp10 family phage protein
VSSVKIKFNHLPQMTSSIRGKVGHEVQQAALAIEGQAKALAPVDTGALRNSIQTEMEGDLTAHVTVGVEYAEYVEHGTYKMAPQPYLTPAAALVEPQFIENVKAALRGLGS